MVTTEQLISEVVIKDSASAVADRITASNTKLAASEQVVQTTMATSSRGAEAAGRSFDRLRASVDDVFAKQQRLAAGTNAAQRAVDLGKTSQEQANQTIADLAIKLGLASPALDKLSSKFKLSYTNVEILRSGIINTVQSLLAGMDPIQTFTTQFAQTAPVLGEVATQTGLTTTAMIALGAAGVVVVGGLGALAIAYEQGVAQTAAFNRALSLSGNAAGLTADSFDRIVTSAAQAGNISASAARSIGTDMASTGKLSQDVISKLLSLTADYAAATKTDVATAGQNLTSLFSDPEKALKDLDGSYNLLSASQRQYVQDLIDQGNKTQAQIQLADDLNGRLKNLSTDGMGTLGKAWYAIGSAASAAWNNMQGIGRGETLEQQLERAKTVLAGAGVGGGRGNLAAGMTKPQAQAAVDQLQSQIDAQNMKAADDARDATFRTLSKDIADAGAQYDSFNQKQRDLTNESIKWQNTIDQLAKDERISNSASDTTKYAQSLVDAQHALAGVKAAQTALLTPTQQAQQKLSDQAAVNAQPSYLRSATSTYYSTLRQDSQSRDQTIRDQAETHAQAEKTGILLQQNQAIADQNTQLDLQHSLSLGVADAWDSGAAAAAKADAIRQASLDSLNSGINVTTAAMKILQKQADDALISASQTLDQLKNANLQQSIILDAAGQGRGTEHQAVITQQIIDKTQQFQVALQNATDPAVAERLRQKIQDIGEEITRADDIANQMNLQHALQDQTDQITLLQKQLDLIGQNTSATAVAMAQTQAQIDLVKMHADANSDLGKSYIDNATKAATLTAELQRQQSISQELPNFFDQAFDRIGSDLTNLTVSTGSWGDSFKQLESIGLGVLSELQQEAFKLIAINPIKNWLNGDSALPTLTDFIGKVAGSFSGDSFEGYTGNVTAWGGTGEKFAGGGIMTRYGSIPLRTYSGGGVTSTPQAAIFGEGSVPEAYVPVPSGRIPVELRGANDNSAGKAGSNVQVNVINNGSDQATVSQGKGPNQQDIINIVIGKVASDIRKGGPVGQAVQSTFGATKVPGIARG